MARMSDIATELTCHWRPASETGYMRQLPDRTIVHLYPKANNWYMQIGHEHTRFNELHDAVIAAGVIAKQQLKEQAYTWQ